MMKGRYYRRHRREHRDWEISLGKLFVNYFDIKSLIDFGCGIGAYLEGALSLGIPIHGVEKYFEVSKLSTSDCVIPFIEVADLKDDLNYYNYDCSMSIEVPEHLEPKHSVQFIKNLTKASNRVIIFTAAPPGQGGLGHINCQTREFWINLIENTSDFRYNDEKTSSLKELMKNTGCPEYIMTNIMIFFIGQK